MDDIDAILNELIWLEDSIKWQQERAAELRDQLTALHDAGEIDGTFTHEDWSFTYSAGRRSWTYPPVVKAIETQLKSAKNAAQADGTAEARTGAPFWTLRRPEA